MEEIYIICKKINEIIIDKLKEDINKFTNKVNLDEDIISLINHIGDELENAYDLCFEGNIVSSMILLRSTFENMLFSMNILYNPELLEEYKKIKNNIQPKRLKNEIIENWDKYFTEIMESKEQTEIEIKNIYDILSKFIHANCVRTTASMIEKDKEKVEIIKYLYIQNITSVILMYMDFINKYLKTENSIIYSIFLYELICLGIYFFINKDKVEELAQYNDYMYLHINGKEIENYKNIINRDIDKITELDENSWKIILENLQENINGSKYIKRIGELNDVILNLINKAKN